MTSMIEIKEMKKHPSKKEDEEKKNGFPIETNQKFISSWTQSTGNKNKNFISFQQPICFRY